MNADTARDRLREAGISAWRAAILATTTFLVIVMYLGMALLVFRGQMADGPLILFTGVILGYLLRSVRGLL